ncbi:IS1096 element passenger TnpR family protein [Paraburkholderia hiiakae]|uniref:IS1096 element passenger TnpR family protein n=1 Tax=Paraburkholderia hiiakae TaxID=1081782 RepID=UPI001919D085
MSAFAYLCDFTSWWLHDVRVERRTCAQRSSQLPRCVAGAGRCPPEDTGGPERYMNALEVHGEHEFFEWIETLREGQIDVNDLRVEADEWLIWLDRCFDRRAANERLQTLARQADRLGDVPGRRLRCRSACRLWFRLRSTSRRTLRR